MPTNLLTTVRAGSRQATSGFLPGVFQSNPSILFHFIVCSLAAALLFGPNLRAPQTNALPRQRAEFINKYCADCHDDVSAKSGLDLVHQSFDRANPNNFETWVKVHD